MTEDLAGWLLEQIAEDERLASAASPGPWKANAEHDEVWAVDDEPVADGFALSNNQLRATVDHMVNFDPARVLVECDAKRRVVAMHTPGERDRDCPECTLKLLALPYADRPGYRAEWSFGA